MQVVEIYRSASKPSGPPVSLEGQIMWREFFWTVGAHTPNFDRMEGNALCRQIPWDDNPEFLKAWPNDARTGDPIIYKRKSDGTPWILGTSTFPRDTVGGGSRSRPGRSERVVDGWQYTPSR